METASDRTADAGRPETGAAGAALDEQHRELMALLSRLREGVLHGSAPGEVTAVFEALVTAVRTHFHAEEARMAAAGYPSLAGHRAEHAAFVRELDELADRVGAGRYSAAGQRLTALKSWFQRHALDADQRCVPYLSTRTAGEQEAAGLR
jgi:hemerythrin-like metal-binding protein